MKKVFVFIIMICYSFSSEKIKSYQLLDSGMYVNDDIVKFKTYKEKERYNTRQIIKDTIREVLKEKATTKPTHHKDTIVSGYISTKASINTNSASSYQMVGIGLDISINDFNSEFFILVDTNQTTKLKSMGLSNSYNLFNVYNIDFLLDTEIGIMIFPENDPIPFVSMGSVIEKSLYSWLKIGFHTNYKFLTKKYSNKDYSGISYGINFKIGNFF